MCSFSLSFFVAQLTTGSLPQAATKKNSFSCRISFLSFPPLLLQFDLPAISHLTLLSLPFSLLLLHISSHLISPPFSSPPVQRRRYCKSIINRCSFQIDALTLLHLCSIVEQRDTSWTALLPIELAATPSSLPSRLPMNLNMMNLFSHEEQISVSLWSRTSAEKSIGAVWLPVVLVVFVSPMLFIHFRFSSVKHKEKTFHFQSSVFFRFTSKQWGLLLITLDMVSCTENIEMSVTISKVSLRHSRSV